MIYLATYRKAKRMKEIVEWKNNYARNYLDPKFSNRLKLPDGMMSGYYKYIVFDELEKSKRKVYAGGIGYFSANGEFDTCIALRTAVAKKDKFYVQAGAGIVADSIPTKEYEETINKAKALINALK